MLLHGRNQPRPSSSIHPSTHPAVTEEEGEGRTFRRPLLLHICHGQRGIYLVSGRAPARPKGRAGGACRRLSRFVLGCGLNSMIHLILRPLLLCPCLRLALPFLHIGANHFLLHAGGCMSSSWEYVAAANVRCGCN